MRTAVAVRIFLGLGVLGEDDIVINAKALKSLVYLWKRVRGNCGKELERKW